MQRIISYRIAGEKTEKRADYFNWHILFHITIYHCNNDLKHDQNTNRGAIEEMGKADELLQKAAQPVINLMFVIIPIVINSMTTAYKFYKKLPICKSWLSVLAVLTIEFA